MMSSISELRLDILGTAKTLAPMAKMVLSGKELGPDGYDQD